MPLIKRNKRGREARVEHRNSITEWGGSGAGGESREGPGARAFPRQKRERERVRDAFEIDPASSLSCRHNGSLCKSIRVNLLSISPITQVQMTVQ